MIRTFFWPGVALLIGIVILSMMCFAAMYWDDD